jgi:cytoskeletal protein RodZ
MFHYKNITSKAKGGVVIEAAAPIPDAGKAKATPRRRRRGRSRMFWLLLLLVIAAAAGYNYWANYLAPKPVVAPPTTAVTRADIQQTVLANGILQANGHHPEARRRGR